MRCRRCDHRRLFHQHHHARTHCSQCSCAAYVPWWRLRVREVPHDQPSGGSGSQRDATPQATPAVFPEVEPGTGAEHAEPQADGR